jgi:hypothetical protein
VHALQFQMGGMLQTSQFGLSNVKLAISLTKPNLHVKNVHRITSINKKDFTANHVLNLPSLAKTRPLVFHLTSLLILQLSGNSYI